MTPFKKYERERLPVTYTSVTDDMTMTFTTRMADASLATSQISEQNVQRLLKYGHGHALTHVQMWPTRNTWKTHTK